jgi:Co/Zn/Cd efflux system component
MRSTWACSRNDIIANLSVLGASLLVSITRSGAPDLIVGASISILFIASAIGVFRDAKAALEQRTIEMQTSAETAKV